MLADMTKISEIEEEIASIFYRTWASEIKDEKPDQDATRAEMEAWTAAAKAKFHAAIDNLAAKAILKYGK